MKTILFTIFLLPATALCQELVRLQNGAGMTVQAGAAMTVQGGWHLEHGSSLTNQGSIIVQRYGPSGTADWLDHTTTGYHHGTGTVVFNSTGIQQMSSANRFGTIEVNNGGLTLNASATADNWILTNGLVQTGNFSVIVASTGAGALSAAASNAGYVNSWIGGNLRRFVTPAVVNEYSFPVGSAVRLNLLQLTNLTSNPLTGISYLDARFGAKPGSDAGLAAAENGTSYISVNNGGVLYLSPDAVPTSGSYDLLLYFNGFTGLQDNRFGILRRPDASTNGADWQVPAGSSVAPTNGAGRKVMDGYARRNNITGFSQFGIGQTSFALPVAMPDFFVKRKDRFYVEVSWYSLTETANHGFFIERRKAGEQHFERVGFVPSKAPGGTSASRIDYQFTDANAFDGISYYRIRQEDINGQAAISAVKAVDGLGTATASVLVWPNPAQHQLQIRIDGTAGMRQGFLFDATGRTVRRFSVSSSTTVDISGIASGAYTVLVQDAFGQGRHFTEKISITGK